MAYFKQGTNRFENFSDVVKEFENLYSQLGRFVVTDATRAPNSKDLGLFWLFNDSNTMRLYARSPKSGNWTEIT